MKKNGIVLFGFLLLITVGLVLQENYDNQPMNVPLLPKITDFEVDCNDLNNSIIEEEEDTLLDAYRLKSMQYSSNGICLRFQLKEEKKVQIHIEKDNQVLYNYTLVYKDKYYETDLNLSDLENGTYHLTITIDSKEDLKQDLDQLEQLVRGKIQNKLVTFSYEDDTISFAISDFAYEYDILIDPGHGGIDGGTQNSTLLEKDLNLEQSLYEKRRYEEHGLKVFMARTDSGDGLLIGDDTWNRAKKRGYAIGYYGVVSKFVYSNHHNYTPNANTGGFEIIVSNLASNKDLEVEFSIYQNWLQIYPESLRTNHLSMYSRDYLTGDAFNKANGDVIDKIDWYATIRLPLQLYNVYTTTYEGCYLQNVKDFQWYYKEGNWKKLSEAKIKAYVEALGKTYIPVQVD